MSTRLLLCTLLAAAVGQPSRLPGQAGSLSSVLRDRLTEPVPGVSLEDTPLRRAFARLGGANPLPVLIDRRVDPTRPVSLERASTTIGRLARDLARRGDAHAAAVGGTVYVGPPDATARLFTLVRLRREELKELRGGRDVRLAVRERRDVRWDDLDRAADVVGRTAAAFNMKIANPEAVPHDLWAGATLSGVDGTEALSLVLIGFDRTFAWAADGTVRVVPVPADFAADPADAPPPLVDPRAVPAGVTPLDRRTFTLTAKGAGVRAVMDRLADSGIVFEYDERDLVRQGGDLNAAVDLNLTAADADGLFDALFTPAGIAFEWEGVTVRLEAAGE